MSSLYDRLAREGFNTSKLPRHMVVGRFYRLPAPGKPKGDTSGWVKLLADGVASYGSWSDGSKHTWKADDRERPARHIVTADRNRRHAEQAEQYEQAAGAVARIWARALPAVDHPYLTRKKAAAHGLRVHNGRLVIPVRDALTGELISLQYIAADGSKLFAQGGRTANGCHIIAGTLPRIFCEGYATGATLHAATGREVVVCFSAGNLQTVAKAIAKPGDVVAADNDNAVKPGALFSKQLSAYGTGHKAAIATGLPFFMPARPGADFNDMTVEQVAAVFAAKPLTALPVFAKKLVRLDLKGTTREQWLKQLAGETDPKKAAGTAYSVASRMFMNAPAHISLQEIRQAVEGVLTPGTVHPATLDAITTRMDRLMEWRKKRALEAVTIPAEILARHRVESITEWPAMTAADYQGVIVLWAPMASGKTREIGAPFVEWAKRAGPVLAICHRVSLVNSLARALDAEHYKDVEIEDAGRIVTLATCLPSLVAPRLKPFVDHAEFVFVDEIKQVIEFLQSDAHFNVDGKNSEHVYNKLREIVTKAKCVIVADAGVDRRTMAFLEECRPGEAFRIMQMAPRKEGIAARYHTGGNAPAIAVGECLEELEAGGKVWIACESRRRTEALGKLFTGNGYRVMAVHSSNKDNTDQAAFLANVDAESRRYDVVIASPVIGSGVSVEHRDGAPHFTLGAYIGGGHSITPADAAQMLRRVRYLRDFVLAMIPNSEVGRQSAEGVLIGQREAAKLERTTAVENSFSRLVAGVKADHQNHRSDFAAGLLWQLDKAHWTLAKGEDSEGAGKALETAMEQVAAEHRAALMAAPVLTDEEAKRLESLPARTMIQNEHLEAHRIRQALGVTVLDDATLDIWDDGRAVRRMDRFSAFRGVVSSFNDRSDNIARRRFQRATASAYAKLLSGINLTSDRITEEMAETVIKRVIGPRRFLLVRLGIVPAKFAAWMEDKDGNLIPPAMPKNPRQELAAILGLMGLEWKRREGSATHTLPQSTLGNSGRGVGKTGRRLFYQVTPESLTLMALWADRRNTARLVERVAEVEPIAAEQAPAPAPVLPDRPASIIRLPEPAPAPVPPASIIHVPELVFVGDGFPWPEPKVVRITPALIAKAQAEGTGSTDDVWTLAPRTAARFSSRM
jgi:putative DNA primase/helicase